MQRITEINAHGCLARKSARSKVSYMGVGHRLWVALCFIFALWCALARPILADTAPDFHILYSGRPILSHIPPALAIDDTGQCYLAWLEYSEQGSARLAWAAPPNASPTIVAEGLPVEPPSGLAKSTSVYTMVAAQQPVLAWAMPHEQTWVVRAQLLAQGASTEWIVPATASLWTFAVSPSAQIVGAWVDSDGVHAHDARQGLKLFWPLDAPFIIDDLQLALSGTQQGYILWSARNQSEHTTELWYAPLTPDSQPNQITSGGHTLADAAADVQGTLHWVLFGEQGLSYGNNRAQESAFVLVEGLPPQTPVAMEAGPHGIIHVAWLQSGTVGYAHSGDWQASRTRYETFTAQGIALAVDTSELPHLAWIEAEGPSLGLWEPASLTPSLQISWPIQEAVITGETYVQAIANTPPSDWRHIEFYLQEESPFTTTPGPLEEIGIDRDGRDGWGIPLNPTDLDPTRRYRIVAIGVTQGNQRLWATGDWFQIRPSAALWLWPQPFLPELGGTVTFVMTPPPGAERLSHLELYLYSAHTCALSSSAISPLAPDYYTKLQVEGPLNRPFVRLDTSALPDGVYRLKARGHTADGRIIRGYGAHDLTIRNILEARLAEVTFTGPDEKTGEIELDATAIDSYQAPNKVSFYLQPVVTSYFGEIPPSLTDLLWLGQGERTSDGWSLRINPGAEWEQRAWQAWAIGCLTNGTCQAISAQVPKEWAFPPRQPLRLMAPAPNEEIRGVHTIHITVEPNAQKSVKAISAWLQYPDGHLTSLGDLSQTQETWTLSWDTTLHPDGSYHLFFQAVYADDSMLPLRSEAFTVANGSRWQFASPSKGQRLRGFVPIVLFSIADTPWPEHVYLYYRDTNGTLAPIGPAQFREGTWNALWNTFTALDGAYTLVAQLEAAGGLTTYVEQPVEVCNGRPTVSFLDTLPKTPLRGQQRLAWTTQQPWPSPLSLTLEYSPDAGGHWFLLAQDLPPEGAYEWDTMGIPDSDTAFLRLTATNGRYYDQSLYGPLHVDNVNEPPTIRLFQPQPNQTLGRFVTIAWQASDVDQDDVSIALFYRADEGPWKPLASGLPAKGTWVWDTTSLTPASGYALRITAQDDLQAQTSEVIANLTIVHNSPPEISLVWPTQDVRLLTEAAVLWSARDPDGDPLAIDLYYSDDGGLRWFPLAEDLPNRGYYIWQVSFLPPGDAYRLRVIAKDPYTQAYDESRGLITLGSVPLPRVYLLFPEPGQVVSGIWPIRWTVGDIIGDEIEIDVLARSKAVGAWRPIVEGLKNTDYYLWDTTSWADGFYEIAVRIRKGEERTLSNVVDYIAVRNAVPRPVEVSLEQPKGGELWFGLREIRWQVQGGKGPLIAHLELSGDAGKTWHSLGQVDARQGRYLLDTSQWPSGSHYLFRISVTDGEKTTMASSPGVWSIANKGVSPPSLLITSPTPSGALRANGLIRWIAEDLDGDPLWLEIWLSQDGGETWKLVRKEWPNTGEYRLPDSLEIGCTYRVQLVVSDGLHRLRVRSSEFSLPIPEQLVPQILITAPTEGDTLQGRILIAWQANDPAGLPLTIDIAYSRNGGYQWSAIAQDIPNSGRYLWETNSLPNGLYILRLTVDNGRFSRSVFSPPFTIANARRNAPVVSWVETNASQAIILRYQAFWRAWDTDGDRITLRIDYSLGPHGPWVPLAKEIPNTGYYAWEANALPIANDLWLRLVATDGYLESSPVYKGPLSTCCPAAPRLSFISPQGGAIWTGQQPIRWQGSYNGNGKISVVIQQSLDNGRTWHTLAENLPLTGTYPWNAQEVPNGSFVLFRLVAQAGSAQTILTTPSPILVYGNPWSAIFPWSAP